MTKKWAITLFIVIFLTAAVFIAISATTSCQLNDWPSIAIFGELIVGVFILGIMKTKTEKDKKKNLSTWSYLGLCMVTPGLIILRLIHEIDAGSIINIIVLYGLVIVTIEYAKSTEQMANEMREQTLVESRPYIIQKAIHDLNYHRFTHFEIYNAGKGPAIEVEISITEADRKSILKSVRKTYLKSAEEHIERVEGNVWKLCKEKVKYYLVSEYRGISSNTAQQVWYQVWLPLLEVNQASDGKGIFVTCGELEFKDEVSEKDRVNAFRDVRQMEKKS